MNHKLDKFTLGLEIHRLLEGMLELDFLSIDKAIVTYDECDGAVSVTARIGTKTKRFLIQISDI